MPNPDFDSISPDNSALVFQTYTKTGIPISDAERGNLASKIVAEGYIRFNDHREGPWTHLSLRFIPCLFPKDPIRCALYQPWETQELCDTSNLTKTPEGFLKAEELLNPFANRLSLVALVMDQIPDKLPDAYPQWNGRFPLEIVHALNHFLVNPDYSSSILKSEYGFDIHQFIESRGNRNRLKRKFNEISPQLKKTLIRLTMC